MSDEQCVFCRIINRQLPAKIEAENDDWVVIEDLHPRAPVHVLLIPRMHFEKKDTIGGKINGFWEKAFVEIEKVIRSFGLDKSGYVIRNNGAGYNHLEHEHIHILGGSKKEPLTQNPADFK